FDTVTMSKEFHQKVEDTLDKFFKAHTRQELSTGAQQRGVFLQIVATPKDIMESRQLAERQFWVDIPHPELGRSIRYPGSFVKASATPLKLERRAPLIGEHNVEIYENELGFTQEEIEKLKAKGVT
ncbi:MAG: CoA transferase, partial [Dehalococcoidia bacterium]|nr:CoA transferase [Dehalococcoidia bacterium]